ncbi:MAG TPA: ImmA/IrrE family metallo-endopeptidase [Chthonomonadaceae bacterium]|nr:ImmA/IrrE family metallo-endopeptidase [Chthonomonadaceae bacterium]
MSETWMEEAAERLWRAAGGVPSFPRNMESLVSFALPLDVIRLPKLTVRAAEDWIVQRRGVCHLLCQNRALCGCVVALRGIGVVFLDADDPSDERRFTLAHEIAHFLLDYLFQREAALHAFGPTIRPVLDGDRPPTTTERLHALLADVPLGLFINLMEREADGRIVRGPIWNAENRADILAIHLLAPFEAVRAHLSIVPKETERLAFEQDVETVLQNVFGLPSVIAQDYTRWLWQRLHRPSSRDWLGLS